VSSGKWIHSPAKKAITEGLFSLMEEKPFQTITVSEVIERSGVARSTYYRNFYYKEDIVKGYLDFFRAEMLRRFEDTPVLTEDPDVYLDDAVFEQIMLFAFTMAKREQHHLTLIVEGGLGGLLLDLMESYADSLIPESDVEGRYEACFIQGASYSMLVRWLRGGAKESPEAVAHRLVMYLSEGVL
jgi:AcrR family transcriptional regulator